MVSQPGQAQTRVDSSQEDVCQQRCIHPEHALAVRRNMVPADTALRVAALFAVLSDPTRLQVVTTRKAGRVVYYRLTDEHMRVLLELGMTHANELPIVPLKRETDASV